MKTSYINHSRDLVHALQEFDNLGLVSGLYAGEEASPSACSALFGDRQVVEFAARVRFVSGIFILAEHTNTPAK